MIYLVWFVILTHILFAGAVVWQEFSNCWVEWREVKGQPFFNCLEPPRLERNEFHPNSMGIRTMDGYRPFRFEWEWEIDRTNVDVGWYPTEPFEISYHEDKKYGCREYYLVVGWFDVSIYIS